MTNKPIKIEKRKNNKKGEKKINKKEEQKFIKLYVKFIKNVNKFRSWQYIKKFDFKEFKENIFELLDSEYITYVKAKNLLTISIKYYR